MKAHLQASKVHDDEVRCVGVKTRLWYQQVGWLEVDLQVQNLPGLNDVGQTCRDGRSAGPQTTSELLCWTMTQKLTSCRLLLDLFKFRQSG